MSKELPKSAGRSQRKLDLLASLLAEEGVETRQSGGIPRRQNQDEHPLSSGQQRLWVLDQVEGGFHYNDPRQLFAELKYRFKYRH